MLLLVISLILAYLIPSWIDVGQYDVLIFALMLAPMALMQTKRHSKGIQEASHSIFFNQYRFFFDIVMGIVGFFFLFALYKYYTMYGFSKMIFVLLVSSILQSPLYAELKFRIGIEILLFPIMTIPLILFYIVVI